MSCQIDIWVPDERKRRTVEASPLTLKGILPDSESENRIRRSQNPRYISIRTCCQFYFILGSARGQAASSPYRHEHFFLSRLFRFENVYWTQFALQVYQESLQSGAHKPDCKLTKMEYL